MSATNRGATRQEHDFYPTPEWAINLIMAEVRGYALTNWYSWLEPAAGDFRIYSRMPQRREWAEIQKGRDYFAKPYPADICLTNPPFALALEFAQKALAECKTVVFLQRLGWLGSDDRREFWQANPPTHLFPLSQRPSFTAETVTARVVDLFDCEVEIGGKKGKDSADYAWYAWDRIGVFKRPPGIHVL
jgi:hypothetical protein